MPLPYKRDWGGIKVAGEGNVMTKAEGGMLLFEDGGRHHQLTNTGWWPVEAGKGKEIDSPSESPKETALLTP